MWFILKVLYSIFAEGLGKTIKSLVEESNLDCGLYSEKI